MLNRSTQITGSALLVSVLLSACGGGSDISPMSPFNPETITTGLGPCFFSTNDGILGEFSGGWTWLDGSDPTADLTVVYSINDNSTACGGTGGTTKPAPEATYTLTWRLPVTGGYTVDVLVTVTNETGEPTVVDSYTDTTIAISTPDVQLAGGGNWIAAQCPLNITSVTPSLTENQVIVTGSLACNARTDPEQLLTRPAPIVGTPESSVMLDKPIQFTTVITLVS